MRVGYIKGIFYAIKLIDLVAEKKVVWDRKLSLQWTLSTISNKIISLQRKLKRDYFYRMFEESSLPQKTRRDINETLDRSKENNEINIINDSERFLISDKTFDAWFI